MAIISELTRRERFHEIDNCPLASPVEGNRAACAGCPYNALAPGKALVGCLVHVGADVLSRALERLESIAPADHAALVTLLEAQRQRADAVLDTTEIETIAG